jgi:hypothetical protein
MLVEIVIVAATPAEDFDPAACKLHVIDLEIEVEPVLGNLRLRDPLEADPGRSGSGPVRGLRTGAGRRGDVNADADDLSPECRDPLRIGGADLDPPQSADWPTVRGFAELFRLRHGLSPGLVFRFPAPAPAASHESRGC